jgi:transcriptional regulator with XRE-family HTH domain
MQPHEAVAGCATAPCRHWPRRKPSSFTSLTLRYHEHQHDKQLIGTRTLKDKMGQKRSTPVTDERYVGRMIRLLRRRGGLSVRWLASKSGFSPSFISQVELGYVSPSIASLDKIASALGVTISEFFTKRSTDSPLIVKASERQAVRSRWSRARIEALMPMDAGSKMDVYLIILEEGGTSGSRSHTSNEEILAIVFEGKPVITLNNSSYKLRKGDAVTIPAGSPHRWQNLGNSSAQVIKIARHGKGRR